MTSTKAKMILRRDPVESLVAAALEEAGIAFTRDTDPINQMLDFHLSAFDVHIEVKQYHSERISKQMQRVDNIIVIQGLAAARAFAELLKRPAGRSASADMGLDAHRLTDEEAATITDVKL